MFLKESKEMAVNGREIRTVGRVVHNLTAVSFILVRSSVGCMGLNDFRLFGPHKRHPNGKRPATDADVK